jgi:hypothetical protein
MCSGERLGELQNFLQLFVLKFCFLRVYLGKKGSLVAALGGNPYSSVRIILFWFSVEKF